MSDHHEAASTATFPHDAIARMRQLQQLASRHNLADQKAQGQSVDDVRQHATVATQSRLRSGNTLILARNVSCAGRSVNRSHISDNGTHGRRFAARTGYNDASSQSRFP